MQASAPGQATCHATSAADNAAAAAATNRMRAAAGLPAVRADPRLAQVAARHACDMAQRGLMTHRGTSTKGPAQRVKSAGYKPTLTAENIAAGPFDQDARADRVEPVSGHMHNIMIPQVRDFGIGQAIGSDGKTRFWSAVYGAPR